MAWYFGILAPAGETFNYLQRDNMVYLLSKDNSTPPRES